MPQGTTVDEFDVFTIDAGIFSASLLWVMIMDGCWFERWWFFARGTRNKRTEYPWMMK